MNEDDFRDMARKRLLRKFRTQDNAAKRLGLMPQELSHGLTGARKMPIEVLDYLDYDAHKETTITYNKRLKTSL